MADMKELDPNASTSITREQAVLIASRLFAAYLLFWVVADLIELPREIQSAVHYTREASMMGMSFARAFEASYLLRTYMLYVLANILRIVLWLVGAGWFYRCEPRIRNFFSAGAE
jgi:hypothetical protein